MLSTLVLELYVTLDMQQERPILPPELFRPIFSHISHTPSLYALSLSSKMFRDEAQRILFSNPPISNNRWSAYNHLRLLETIVNSPERLAKLVLRYTQTSVWTTSTAHCRGSPDEQNEAIENLTPIALRLMVNLKHLVYRTSGGLPAAHILYGCSFQLETLNWGCDFDEVLMFQDILPTQPQLLRLELTDLDPTVLKKERNLWDSIKELLPDLVSLTGSRATFETILPGRLGRPIECIKWIPNDFDSEEASFNHMSHELGHVKYMAIGGYFRRPSMSLLVDHLLNLELLDILHCTQEVRIHSSPNIFD